MSIQCNVRRGIDQELNKRSAPCAAVVSTQVKTDSEIDCLRATGGVVIFVVVVVDALDAGGAMIAGVDTGD